MLARASGRVQSVKRWARLGSGQLVGTGMPAPPRGVGRNLASGSARRETCAAAGGQRPLRVRAAPAESQGGTG
jgi:hypothetical protein